MTQSGTQGRVVYGREGNPVNVEDVSDDTRDSSKDVV